MDKQNVPNTVDKMPSEVSLEEVQHANNKINEIFEYIEKENNFRNHAMTEYGIANRTKKKKSIITTYILCLFLLPMCLLPYTSVFVAAIMVELEECGFPVPQSDLLMLFMTLILTLIIAIGALLIFESSRKRKHKKHLKKAAMFENKAEENRNIANRIAQDSELELAIIPTQYRYPLALNYIAELFANGRARTIPEALDKFEEQKHRWTMEYGMMKNLEMQEKQIKVLIEIYKWI